MANWFIALVVPPSQEWRACVATLPPGLRLFPPADWHLTVAFLGACGPDAAHAAWAALVPLGHPPIRARAGGWRAMGPSSRPSAYALTLSDGQAEVAALIERWRGPALAAAGCPPERRAPLPHITLARPPRRQEEPRHRMSAWMASAPVPLEPLELGQLALYTWDPQRDHRLFETLAQRSL